MRSSKPSGAGATRSILAVWKYPSSPAGSRPARRNCAAIYSAAIRTRADWSEAFELVPGLQAAYVRHASVFTRELLDSLAECFDLKCPDRIRHTLSLRLETRAAELPPQKTIHVGQDLLILLLRTAHTGVTARVIDPQQDRFAATGSRL
jgi:hypothetical protein